MGHFAKVIDNVVCEVIVAEQDFIDTGLVGDPSQWIRTSYNTRGNVYYFPNTELPHPDQSLALRKNFAGINYTYDPENDAFIPPQNYPSWVLNKETFLWEAPVPYPTEPSEYGYAWNEDTLSWDPINNQ